MAFQNYTQKNAYAKLKKSPIYSQKMPITWRIKRALLMHSVYAKLWVSVCGRSHPVIPFFLECFPLSFSSSQIRPATTLCITHTHTHTRTQTHMHTRTRAHTDTHARTGRRRVGTALLVESAWQVLVTAGNYLHSRQDAVGIVFDKVWVRDSSI